MPHNTKLVGIVNVTPDSFSDGGEYLRPDNALAAIAQLANDGADVIDIGAESTRPGATPLAAEQEWERLEPVLKGLPKHTGVLYSIDTYHPENAVKALDYGAHWINDVSGFASPAMVDAVKQSNCKLVVMHSLSVPADAKTVLPEEADPITELRNFARQRFAELEQAGIAKERLIFDPGIGFGKSAQQSLHILERAEELKELGTTLFIGHSRKSFLGMGAGTAQERDDATLAISHKLVGKGIDFLRVHNVMLHRKMLEEYKNVA